MPAPSRARGEKVQLTLGHFADDALVKVASM